MSISYADLVAERTPQTRFIVKADNTELAFPQNVYTFFPGDGQTLISKAVSMPLDRGFSTTVLLREGYDADNIAEHLRATLGRIHPPDKLDFFTYGPSEREGSGLVRVLNGKTEEYAIVSDGNALFQGRLLIDALGPAFELLNEHEITGVFILPERKVGHIGKQKFTYGRELSTRVEHFSRVYEIVRDEDYTQEEITELGDMLEQNDLAHSTSAAHDALLHHVILSVFNTKSLLHDERQKFFAMLVHAPYMSLDAPKPRIEEMLDKKDGRTPQQRAWDRFAKECKTIREFYRTEIVTS
jgi:hypothetical protein